MSDYHISPEQFIVLLREGKVALQDVIDVREEFEWSYYRIEGTTHLPMQMIPEKLDELPKDRTLYILCAHGVRSMAVCNYMLHHGFTKLKNVDGGIAEVAVLKGFQYD